MSDEARCQVCGTVCPVSLGYKHEPGYIECREAARSKVAALETALARGRAIEDEARKLCGALLDEMGGPDGLDPSALDAAWMALDALLATPAKDKEPV